MLFLTASLLATSAPAHAAVPSWVKPALDYAVSKNYIKRDSFKTNKPMPRSRFRTIMGKAFGGGYNGSSGYVRAHEVSKALVRALGRAHIAKRLADATSPDGWDPGMGMRFGNEVVMRELGLRHDRDTSEEHLETSAGERMRQADVIYAVWKAKTAPSLWGADALANFSLPSMTAAKRRVIRYAMSLVGTPYVWGGEWPTATPPGYPYGAQPHGGMDCSGFVWQVLKSKNSSWSPPRKYNGWTLDERSSAQMATATPKDKRIGYGKLRVGDVVFFASGGRDASPSTVYHAGIYMGKGWMIHSSGSRAGASIGSIAPGSWWHDQIVFARRVIR